MSCRSLEDPLLLPLYVWEFLVCGAKVELLVITGTADFSSSKGLLFNEIKV